MYIVTVRSPLTPHNETCAQSRVFDDKEVATVFFNSLNEQYCPKMYEAKMIIEINA